MQQTILTLVLALAVTGCIESKQTTEQDVIASPEPDEQALVLARDGFANAHEASPPPVVGTTWPILRITRPARTADDLGHRLAAALSAMRIDVGPHIVASWASRVATADDHDVDEIVPGIVVSYDGEHDDLMVVNSALIDTSDETDVSDDALASEVRRVAEHLISAGVVDSSVTDAAADIAIIRSGYGGPNGEHETWIDELVFSLGQRVEGIDLADTILRIGITPAGKVSSVQLTSVLVEHAGRTTVSRTIEDLEDAFAEYVAESNSGIESVQVSARLPSYVLHHDVATGLVEPRYVIVYSVSARHGDSSVTSRSTVTAWTITDSNPSVEVWP
jgi:hypothetical protein